MSIYDFKVIDGRGNETDLHQYQGKVLLIINSAIQCGFTSQYDELQDMYEKYGEEGFIILDFPCNQFANQAPGTNEEIISFCDSRFGITFPIFSKIEVNGPGAIPLFKYLKNEKGFEGFDLEDEAAARLDKKLKAENPFYASNDDIKWNFTKFLVNREGKVVKRYEPVNSLFQLEEDIKNLL